MADGRQRLDKWLWHARVARTRTLAQKLVSEGRVRVNRNRNTDPAHPVGAGDVLTIRLERGVLVYRVVGLAGQRLAYSLAQALYEDLSPPPEESGSGEAGSLAR